jgi:serine/threonine protein kinase
MNGGNLFEKCKNSDFTFKEKISILGQVAKGMASIHKKGFVHFDIKGDNIFLDDQGAKIGDFGFCRKTSDINYDLCEGTGVFMAPEIKKRPSEIAGIKNEKISEADKEKKLNNLQKAGPPADIYSFGVMMLETLVDSEVFESRSLEDVIDGLPYCWGSDCLFNHLETKIRDDLVYIVKGCLRLNIDSRMGDGELGKKLEALEQKMSKSAQAH